MSDETKVREHDWGDEDIPVDQPRRTQRLIWAAVALIIVVFALINYVAWREDVREPMVRTRHILIKCDRYTAGDCDEAYTRIKDIQEKLEAGADFAALAKEFSEDETSASVGGDVGYVTRNELVEEYSEAAFSMEEGEMSDIVQSSYGYHIILVLNRLNPVDWEENTAGDGQT